MKPSNPFEISSKNLPLFVKKNPDYETSAVRAPLGVQNLGVTLKKSSLNVLFMGILAVIFIFVSRSFYLQIYRGEDLRALAEENRVRVTEINPERGLIYDRNQKILVKNEPNFIIKIIPAEIKKNNNKKTELYSALSQILNIDSDDIKKIIENLDEGSRSPEILAENIPYEKALMAKTQADKFSGFSVELETKRNYQEEDIFSLSHVLGYLGRINDKKFIEENPSYSITDLIGKTGIEAYYENELRGKKGKEEVEVDSKGAVQQKISFTPPSAGKNLTLTINFEIQKKLENVLKKALSQNAMKRAAGVATDPRNGEILALVSLPAFDNNLFSQGITGEALNKITNNPDQPLFNRAVLGQYPSGSTFKLVIGLAALEENIIKKNTTIMSVGGVWINQWFFPDWKREGHGPTNIIKALSESVNTFFYYIGGGYQNFQGLGVEKINYYGSLAGAGKKTNIDLPNESAGLLPNPKWKEETKNERWYIGDTYHLSIGQGDILATPLQIAQWTALIANDGRLYRPHLLKTVYDPEKDSLKKINPEIILNEVFQKENIFIIQEGMRTAITEGSAQRASGLGIKIAGKTGTAQWSESKENHAWFTSFAPYENPTIVLTILIEEGGEGSAIAVPAAAEFYEWWVKYAKIE